MGCSYCSHSKIHLAFQAAVGKRVIFNHPLNFQCPAQEMDEEPMLWKIPEHCFRALSTGGDPCGPELALCPGQWVLHCRNDVSENLFPVPWWWRAGFPRKDVCHKSGWRLQGVWSSREETQPVPALLQPLLTEWRLLMGTSTLSRPPHLSLSQAASWVLLRFSADLH